LFVKPEKKLDPFTIRVKSFGPETLFNFTIEIGRREFLRGRDEVPYYAMHAELNWRCEDVDATEALSPPSPAIR
jgi:hypothetical protein